MSEEKKTHRVKMFNIRIGDGHDLEDEALLNDFLESVEVDNICSSLVNSATSSFWSVLVTYKDVPDEDLSPREIIYDAHEVLSPEEEELFTQLSHWRYQEAARLNLPSHLIFHNAHIKTFIKTMPSTLEEMKKIRGLARRKVEKYGEQILVILNEYRK